MLRLAKALRLQQGTAWWASPLGVSYSTQHHGGLSDENRIYTNLYGRCGLAFGLGWEPPSGCKLPGAVSAADQHQL